MLDFDGFKEVNDRLGHMRGDEILQQQAALLGEAGTGGTIYRYGGDEFAVILPGMDSEEAVTVAEGLRAAFERSPIGRMYGLTISAGVASYPRNAHSVEELIYGADSAMYWAKIGWKEPRRSLGSREKGRRSGCWRKRRTRSRGAGQLGALL